MLDSANNRVYNIIVRRKKFLQAIENMESDKEESL